MLERPIRAAHLGPRLATATTPATGGDNLGPLIAEADALRLALGYPRFSSLKAWCDDGQPLTTDADGLELMVERLCIVLENRHG
ncbi:MAG TPA: hypothetical protein VLO13_00335 [Halomonas sp.]|nr:hypothetical protein [Halomonas sp.]